MAERFFIATAKDTSYRTDLGPNEMWSAVAVSNLSDKLITLSSIKAKWPLPSKSALLNTTTGIPNTYGMVDLCRITDYSGGTEVAPEKFDTAATDLDSDVKLIKHPDSVTLDGSNYLIGIRAPHPGTTITNPSMPAFPLGFDEIGMASLLCAREGSVDVERISLRQNQGIAFCINPERYMVGSTILVQMAVRRSSGSCFVYSFQTVIKAPDQVLFCLMNKDATEVVQPVDISIITYGSSHGASLGSPQFYGSLYLQKVPASILGGFLTGEDVPLISFDSTISPPSGLVVKKETDYPIWAQIGEIHENMLSFYFGGDNGRSMAASDGICAGLSLIGSLGTRPADPTAWMRPFWQLGVGLELLGASPLILRPGEVLMISSPRRFLMNSVSSYQAQKPGIAEHLMDIEMFFTVDDIASGGGGAGPTDFAY